MSPTVSIALCTFNGAQFLEEQLQSFADQTRLPDELVVCDDGSTDATITILESFARRAPFRVRVQVNEKNLGYSQNFGEALGLCDGELIFFSDQDDLWLPNKVERFCAELARQSCELIASDGFLMKSDGHRQTLTNWNAIGFSNSERECFRAGNAMPIIVRKNSIAGSSLALTKALKAKLLPIPACWIHDYWALSLAAARGSVALIDEPLYCYRQHSGQSMGLPQTIEKRVMGSLGQGLSGHQITAERFATLRDRLGLLELSGERLSATASLIEQKINLEQTRAKFPDSKFLRFFAIGKELFRGSYHRFDAGISSAAKDLLA